MTTVSPFPAGSVKGRLLQHLLRSKNDPCYFNDVILQRGPMWSAQKEWSEAVVAYRQVCIESGNMTGKGWWIAGLILWYLWTRKESLVYVTGPGQTSLGAVLWKEVRRAVEGSRFWRAGLLPAVVSPGIKASPATVVVRPGWQALGFSTTSVPLTSLSRRQRPPTRSADWLRSGRSGLRGSSSTATAIPAGTSCERWRGVIRTGWNRSSARGP